MLAGLINRLLGVSRIDDIVDHASATRGSRTLHQAAADALQLRLVVSEQDVARIPAQGPVIVCANHPMGVMEGLSLVALLQTVRGDVKTVAHTWFRRWPEVAERMFLVTPKARETGRPASSPVTKSVVSWLRQDGMVLVFPAGEVARFHIRSLRTVDSPWHSGIARLVRATGATVVPVHVSGRNSLAYCALSVIHPRLAAMLLAWELLNKRGKAVRVRVGQPIRPECLPETDRPEVITHFLRRAVERLEPGRPRRWLRLGDRFRPGRGHGGRIGSWRVMTPEPGEVPR